ncbi:hypothetical protein KFL_011430030 [Klebsormidium nitens]|uniref:Uncharacterized protein n=1 Tax=Klebsormidium nitens TaxID=105231 RepID=A0A1Y1ITA4_KLENI|nr:hypothetical protein KFL_011430030 [Klebsormidium nitens]|eukprot:GAQ92799.1 hypothetical protein KFL_011430030 [Klebsormidium nitens]
MMTLCSSIGRLPAVSAGACVKYVGLGKKQIGFEGCTAPLSRCSALKPHDHASSAPQHKPDKPAPSIRQRRLKLPGSAITGDPSNRSSVMIEYQHDGGPLTRDELHEDFQRVYPETTLWSDEEWEWILEDVPQEKQAEARQAVEAMRRRSTGMARESGDGNGSESVSS